MKYAPAFLMLIGGLLLIAGSSGGVSPGPVDPDNPVIPEPVPITSFRVIFVKESGQTLSGEQLAIPGAKEIRDYLEAKTTPENGQSGWREYDPDQQTANEQPTMKALWSAVKPKLLSPPCLVVEVNGNAKVMPFPATVSETMDILKKAAGDG